MKRNINQIHRCFKVIILIKYLVEYYKNYYFSLLRAGGWKLGADNDLYGMPTITDASDQVITTSSIDNDYLFHARRYDKKTNLYFYRARYYDPIMGRFLQTDPMGYKDSMNLYQAFNMNGINYVDPFGELIYFTGENPKADFEVFKNIFVQMGVSRKLLNKSLILEQDEEGRYYVTRSSYIPFAKSVDRDRDNFNEKLISKWREKHTTNLKNTNRFRTRLEFIFSWIIQHPFPIEFSIDKYAFYGVKGEETERSRFRDKEYGRGVFLQPHDKLNTSAGKDIQIVVDPDPKWSLVNGEYFIHKYGTQYLKKGHKETIPLPLEATIVHEFGHAYAFLKGHKVDPKSHTSTNAEIAVLLENWYRLRTILKRYGLRMYH